MDLGTGRTYASREEALAAGVPAADIMAVSSQFDPWRKERAARTVATQGTRERRRRLRQRLHLAPEESR